MKDVLGDFIKSSREDPGTRETLKMKREKGNAGFCIRATGSSKAIKALLGELDKIDLSEHQPEE